MNQITKNRLKLVGMATLFFAPMLLAVVLYYGPAEWKPSGRTAHGHLVDPARPLPSLDFAMPNGDAKLLDEKLWTVLHVANTPCEDVCTQRLWQTRQMRTLLHRRRGRVQRAILLSQDDNADALWGSLEAEHPRLKVLTLSDQERQQFDAWLGALPVKDPVLLIDPLGNFLMYYGDDLPLKGMFSDIKRVLKLSNIG